MRRTFVRITLTAAATVGLAVTGSVQALGLGEIDVSSNLNQRFTASIPLTDISAEDLETVTVSIAPNDAFERAGIDRAEYLSSLDFEIKNDRGRPRVVVTSSQIAREPVLDLLVQARWSGGKIQRDYTILLDPPAVVTSSAKAAATASAPVIAGATIAAKPAVPVGSEFYETPVEAKPAVKPARATPVKPAPAPAAAIHDDPLFDSATGTYGPVASKETLWSIAGKLRPSPAVTMDQMLLALAEANPVAIQRATTVSQGVTLRVPSSERIQSTPPAVAKTKLAALRAGGAVSAPSKPAAAVTKPAAAKSPVKTAEPIRPLDAALNAGISSPPVIAAPTPATTAAQPAVPAPASTTTAAATAGTTASAPAQPAATVAAAQTPAAATPVPAAAAPTTAAPAPAKSPLAQPLPESDEPSFWSSFGMPLIFVALLAFLAAVLLAWSRRRKASGQPKDFTQFKPGDTSSVLAPAGGAGALGRLGDKARDTQSATTRAVAAGATQQLTQPVQPAAVPAAAASHQSTLILDPEVMATLNSAVKPSAVTGGSENFDKTAQVQVDTLQINLSDNDPLSEADFHLAYGLYDEAILLLKTAVQKQPQRTDLKVKLAETYFAAGRPMEFQEIAEDLQPQLSPSEWSKVAIMGSQICPDVAMFQGGETDGGFDADFDLAFDEPATPSPMPSATPSSNSVEFSLSAPAVLSTPPLASSLPPMEKLSLEDDFDDALSDKKAQPPAGLDDDASIDFMLGQSLTPLGAGMRVPEPADLSFNLGSPSLNVDVPKLDRSKIDASNSLSAMTDRATLTSSSSPLSLSLQDLEVSITPRQSEAESMDEDLNTKLDLARAYVEMGDNDMARSLLVEVQQQGGDRHQQEAASLLQRLPA